MLPCRLTLFTLRLPEFPCRAAARLRSTPLTAATAATAATSFRSIGDIQIRAVGATVVDARKRRTGGWGFLERVDGAIVPVIVRGLNVRDIVRRFGAFILLGRFLGGRIWSIIVGGNHVIVLVIVLRSIGTREGGLHRSGGSSCSDRCRRFGAHGLFSFIRREFL